MSCGCQCCQLAFPSLAFTRCLCLSIHCNRTLSFSLLNCAFIFYIYKRVDTFLLLSQSRSGSTLLLCSLSLGNNKKWANRHLIHCNAHLATIVHLSVWEFPFGFPIVAVDPGHRFVLQRVQVCLRCKFKFSFLYTFTLYSSHWLIRQRCFLSLTRFCFYWLSFTCF